MRIGSCDQERPYSHGEAHIRRYRLSATIRGNPVWKPISAETKARIDTLLLERVSLAGIVRVTGVSAQWLQDYVNAKYAAQPQVADIPVRRNCPIILAPSGISFMTIMPGFAPVWSLSLPVEDYRTTSCDNTHNLSSVGTIACRWVPQLKRICEERKTDAAPILEA
jgi:hypothetical protein